MASLSRFMLKESGFTDYFNDLQIGIRLVWRRLKLSYSRLTFVKEMSRIKRQMKCIQYVANKVFMTLRAFWSGIYIWNICIRLVYSYSSVEIQYFAPMHKLSFCMLDDVFSNLSCWNMNGLNRDQDQRFVWPDFGPNCFKIFTGWLRQWRCCSQHKSSYLFLDTGQVATN